MINVRDLTGQLSKRVVTRRRVAVASLVCGVAGFGVLLGWSAARAFEQPTAPVALTAVEPAPDATPRVRPGVPWHQSEMGFRDVPKPVAYETVQVPAQVPVPEPATAVAPEAVPAPPRATRPAEARYNRLGQVIMVGGKPWTGEVYDGKPIRPVRTIRMLTTAYSPDERSCGKWADGITASGYSVWTNGMKLVAADKSIPFGTILTIPGYNEGRPVPVLDRGGAIKGNRLDLLYPTHEIALRWGAQRKDVVVWEYVAAD